jgi:hypothetical protein
VGSTAKNALRAQVAIPAPLGAADPIRDLALIRVAPGANRSGDFAVGDDRSGDHGLVRRGPCVRSPPSVDRAGFRFRNPPCLSSRCVPSRSRRLWRAAETTTTRLTASDEASASDRRAITCDACSVVEARPFMPGKRRPHGRSRRTRFVMRRRHRVRAPTAPLVRPRAVGAVGQTSAGRPRRGGRRVRVPRASGCYG